MRARSFAERKATLAEVLAKRERDHEHGDFQNDSKRLGRSLALPGAGAARAQGTVADLPSLDEIEELTDIPDRRVVFRGVDWEFYDQLVESIPESSNIHVDYDGRDLEVMGKGQKHDLLKKLLGRIVDVLAEEYEIPFAAYGEAIWKRLDLARGLEADDAYYFRPEKLEAAAEVSSRDSQQPADYPAPDLAVEVDLSSTRTSMARGSTRPSQVRARYGDGAGRSSRSSG